VLLCIGAALANQAATKRVPDRHRAVLQAFAFLQEYGDARHAGRWGGGGGGATAVVWACGQASERPAVHWAKGCPLRAGSCPSAGLHFGVMPGRGVF
jgi:hypothetical protein